jgi:UDP-N-acetylmuramoyl-tripeptide--D-alanyl-D-alanine ligase
MSALWSVADQIKATGGIANGEWCAWRVEIDSRKVQAGDLFVAIKGERVDGHDYVAQAFASGAIAAVVSRKLDCGGNQLLVPDTLKALEDLAKYNRARSKAKVVGVTGSVGKTSTKEMLKLALSAHGKTYATSGNYNNHIGTPLNLANLPLDTQFAVFEMGMNHAGEIAHLTRMVRPHIALITGVEAVHLEFFKDVEEIVKAKAEIFEGLVSYHFPSTVTPDLIGGLEQHAGNFGFCSRSPLGGGDDKINGIAVINADQPYFIDPHPTTNYPHPTTNYPHPNPLPERDREFKKITFGVNEKADASLISYEATASGCKVSANIGGKKLDYKLAATGRHWATISLSVLAVINALGLDVQKSATALVEFAEVDGRGRVVKTSINGAEILFINDSYNASPASMAAAFEKTDEVWQAHGKKGRKVALLGDMLELGETSAALHAKLAVNLQATGFDKVYTVGNLMKNLYDALPMNLRAGHAENSAALLPMLAGAFKDGDVVLIKGSHGSKMYEVARAFSFSPTRC